MSTKDGTGESGLIDRMVQNEKGRLGSDRKSTDELIALALSELHAGQDSRVPNEVVLFAMDAAAYVGEDRPSEALAVLQYRGNTEVFNAAQRLCASLDPRERELGATMLGQNLVSEKTFPEEKFDILFGLLENETDPDVLAAACFALGHISDPRAIEPVARFRDHPDADVRWGVVHMMTIHADDLAIKTLIELSADKDDKVRDWATFGLGDIANNLKIDSPEIREALAARLDDPYLDARLEAITGLAMRGDRRALEALRKELEDGWNTDCAFESATALADPSLLPALLELREEGKVNGYLEEAIEACGGEPHVLEWD